MKELNAKHASASEGGEEYFQVMFEEQLDSLENYFLIQRNFEFEEGEKPDPPYIDSDDERFCGHLEFDKVEFNQERFYIRLADEDKNELEVTLDIPDDDYREIKRILKDYFVWLCFRKN